MTDIQEVHGFNPIILQDGIISLTSLHTSSGRAFFHMKKGELYVSDKYYKYMI